MKKFAQKRPLSEEIPLQQVINRDQYRSDFKTARMILADKAALQRNPLVENAPMQPVDVIAVAPAPAAAPMLIQPPHPMPAPQPASTHDHIIAHIQSKHWHFWGHLNPAQPDTSMQSWTDFPTSREVQILKGNAFLIRQSGANARNAAGSKVVNWVCKFQNAQNASDCFAPIKICAFEKKLFSTEITHAEGIAANNQNLKPLILVVKADLIAENHTIREILGSYVSTTKAFSLMPMIWILKNNQVQEFTFQSAQQYLLGANSIKSQLGAKALSPTSADKVRKRELESSRTPTPPDSSTPELKRAETDEDPTLSRSDSVEKDLQKTKISSQPTQSKKKPSQKGSSDSKQKSLMSFFGRPSQGAPSDKGAPKENAGNQPDHLSPDI